MSERLEANDIGRWHRCFAFLPMRTDDEGLVWLRPVWSRWHHFSAYGIDRLVKLERYATRPEGASL